MFPDLNEQPRKHGTPRWLRNSAIIAVLVEVTLTIIWLLWRVWRNQKAKIDS